MGFGPATVKAFLVADQAGRWIFATLFLSGLVMVVAGLLLRRSTARRRRVGIVVTATDPVRELARGAALHDQAENYCQQFSVTLRVRGALESPNRAEQLDNLGELTMRAIRMARVLTPDALQIDLVPTMRLQAGFRFGAYLGNANRDLVVHQDDRAGSYFPAIALRPATRYRRLLTSYEPQQHSDDDASVVAVAVDLQGRGPDFMTPVENECEHRKISKLLVFTLAEGSSVSNDTKAFAAVVQQIADTWRGSRIAAEAAGDTRRFIMLSGPLAISIGLGAALAAQQRDYWTPLSYDNKTQRYEEL